VRIDPVQVLLPRSVPSGSKGEAILDVSEYLTQLEVYDGETSFEVQGRPEVRLEQISPWDAKGWSYTRGYVRRSKFRLLYEVPATWDYSNRVGIRLVFKKTCGAAGGSADKNEVEFALCRV
jgi:hypothetical protein